MYLLLVVVCMFAITHGAQAQDPVTWSIKAHAGSSLKAGDKFTAQIAAQIQVGWHIYSVTQPAGGPNPTRITLTERQPFKLAGTVKGPAPHVQLDPNFGINTRPMRGAQVSVCPLPSPPTERQPRNS